MRNLSAAILALALAAAAQMAYATQQNLIDRFGERELIELTDRADPPTGAIDAAVVTKALADADGAINGYLAVKYQLPISPVPVMFERFGCDIARYYLRGPRHRPGATPLRGRDQIPRGSGLGQGQHRRGCLEPGAGRIRRPGSVRAGSHFYG
jgi:hypothetical protein